MTYKTFPILATLAAMTFAGCGSGTDTSLFPDWDLYSGFQVVALDPATNAQQVPLTAQINIYFNMSVDATTLPGSVKILASSGATNTDITGQGTLSVSSSRAANDTIIFTPSTTLQANTAYQINLLGTLKSTTAIALAPYTYRFTTGFWDAVGTTKSVPGAPLITSWQLFQYQAGCYYMSVTFNEDLAFSPYGTYFYRNEFNNPSGIGGELIILQKYPTDMRNFYVSFDDGGCQLQYYRAVDVQITQATDMTGEVAGTISKQFRIFYDY